MIGSITDSKELVSQAQEGEVQNMCTALENLKKEGVREGIQQGIQQGLRQRTREIVYTLLGKGYTEPEVAALLEMSEEMVEELRKESKS